MPHHCFHSSICAVYYICASRGDVLTLLGRKCAVREMLLENRCYTSILVSCKLLKVEFSLAFLLKVIDHSRICMGNIKLQPATCYYFLTAFRLSRQKKTNGNRLSYWFCWSDFVTVGQTNYWCRYLLVCCMRGKDYLLVMWHEVTTPRPWERMRVGVEGIFELLV